MAIKYKLSDIGILKGGICNLQKEKYGKGILFINYMDVFNNTIINSNEKMKYYDADENEYNKYFLEKGDILFTASSETPEEIAFSSLYWLEEKAIFNGFSKVFKYDKTILLPIYAAYIFRSEPLRNEFKKYATGYTRYNISQKSLKKVSLNIPLIEEQQKIIDIIEPFEKLKNNLIFFKNTQELFLKKISFFGKESNESLKKFVSFNRGKVLKSTEFLTKGITPFIDVRFLNSNKISKYVNYQPNTKENDILLSLDGTPGLVKMNYLGFNGYVYNVKSLHLSKLEIYLNLINIENQKIILNNSKGTTIMHASVAKEKMIYFNYDNIITKHSKLLQEMLLKSLNLLKKIDFVKIKLINLLIK